MTKSGGVTDIRYFDGLGRVWLQKNSAPDGKLIDYQTDVDARGFIVKSYARHSSMVSRRLRPVCILTMLFIALQNSQMQTVRPAHIALMVGRERVSMKMGTLIGIPGTHSAT
jgi:hypothetical protein